MLITDSYSHSIKELAVALERLDAWIEKEQFQGWDPHDALNSPLLQRLAGHNRLIGIALVQLLRRSPANLRPMLGVRKGYNPKAMGLFLANYAKKFLSTHQQSQLEKVQFFSDWLIRHATPGYAGLCWGYNFDWPNRAFFAPAGTPTIVNTAFIALSFLCAEPALKCLANSVRAEIQAKTRNGGKAAGTQDIEALSVARSACDFILRDLNVLRSSDNEICFSYTPLDHRFVHNANVLGAWLLAAVYARTGDRNLARIARMAARFTISRQRPDGSWSYGINQKDQWVDNLHTGYLLVALRRAGQLLQANEYDIYVKKGYEFWKERMFLADSTPKYYVAKTYPIDVHCVTQAILTFLMFSDVDPDASSQAERLCRWAIENLQDPKGFFHYQVHRRHRVRIPYMRWGQAWMQLALTRFVHATGTGIGSDFILAEGC
jgi:hypothetical protein